MQAGGLVNYRLILKVLLAESHLLYISTKRTWAWN